MLLFCSWFVVRTTSLWVVFCFPSRYCIVHTDSSLSQFAEFKMPYFMYRRFTLTEGEPLSARMVSGEPEMTLMWIWIHTTCRVVFALRLQRPTALCHVSQVSEAFGVSLRLVLAICVMCGLQVTVLGDSRVFPKLLWCLIIQKLALWLDFIAHYFDTWAGSFVLADIIILKRSFYLSSTYKSIV